MNADRADDELLAAWRDGDRTAADVLVQRHIASLYRFFEPRVGSHTADLVQRTFMAAVEARDRVEDGLRFRAFLFGIARNLLLMHQRSAARKGRVIDDEPITGVDLGPTPSRVASLRQQQSLLLRALRRLPLDMQITLELFYWEELSRTEIAAVLGVEANTIKSRLQRARTQLKDLICELDPKTGRITADALDEWVVSMRGRYRLPA
jgi:RNA polymerase sigma-70 factor (ECF subfamily)